VYIPAVQVPGQTAGKDRPPGWRITNGIQTNGILIDQEWCRFLASEGFSVGLSLDGPAALHDSYRVNRGGKPSHAQAMRAYDLLDHDPHFLMLVEQSALGAVLNRIGAEHRGVDFSESIEQRRQRAGAAVTGLRIAAELDAYPLHAQYMEAEYGLGVWTRTNGAVLYVGNTTWADPSL
jgi:hypothetical protein